MKEYIQKAKILLEALPYLQTFRRKTFVIKLGGSTMEDETIVHGILKDAVFLESAGIRIVVVHGGGKAITAAMKKAGLQSVFVEGLRVTDKQSIGIVEKVLVNDINAGLVRIINKLGGKGVGFSAADNGVLQCRKEFILKEEEGKKKKMDIGYVGAITHIFTHPIYRLLNVERIPVIAPLGLGPDGFVYNINADTAACEIARKLKAEKLIFVTDVDGIHGAQEELLSSLTIRDVERLIREEVIRGGMIPKSRSMIKALKGGVKKTHIINGNIEHSLLLEIYTDKGIGTELIP
ncbi:MAG: acetylglutamate kinase [Elusimicrobia bacterium RIFOXYB2_FULL_49_7]|nr:MAG: acetylglutamate kinase [Elusimicrobia bacterium RIFOXYB2_FULL_49_7]